MLTTDTVRDYEFPSTLIIPGGATGGRRGGSKRVALGPLSCVAVHADGSRSIADTPHRALAIQAGYARARVQEQRISALTAALSASRWLALSLSMALTATMVAWWLK